MFKKFSLSFGLMLFSMVSLSQNTITDTSATCVAYWNKGDVKELQITRIKQQTNPGKQKEYSRSVYGAVMKILGATDTSYTIEWKYKAPAAVKDSTTAAKLYNLVLNLKIVYTTDETGIFDSLVNYDEIKTFFDESLALLAEQAADKEEFKKTTAVMESLFGSKESLAPLVLREIMLYHSPYGVEYYSNRVQEGETLLPNVFGGEPFPATMQLKLVKQDPAKDLAKFSINQQIDKEKAVSILAEIFKKMAAASEKPFNDKDMIKEITIDDTSTFEVLLSSGWLKNLLFKREVIIGDDRNIETCEIKLK